MPEREKSGKPDSTTISVGIGSTTPKEREEQQSAAKLCRWPWSHDWKPYDSTLGVQHGMAGTQWTATQVKEQCEKCGARRAKIVDGEWRLKGDQLV